ncbi:MAG TPA: FecR family protein [Candidatus Angelobacter sp.]
MPRNSVRRWIPDSKLIRRSGLLLPILTLVFTMSTASRAQDASAAAGSQARIVRVSYVEGEVVLDSGHGYESVTMNVPITEHNWLQTRSNGWAEIQFEDGSIIRLAPETVIAFDELDRASAGGTSTVVDLDQGEAEFKILKHEGSDFKIAVKNKTITLGHSGFFRVTSTNDDPLEVAVLKGDLSVHDPESGDDIAVNKNETFVLNPADVAEYALNKGTEADELDEWSRQRDDSLRAYSAANHYTQSPYQYGASDLNYYGQYTDDPEYGSVWQPNGVGTDWDPFSNGYYADSGIGPTWVSSYPWGWMPYRYGRWVFINARGWFWQPGGWNRLNNGPRFTNAPPGFHPPTPPADLRVAGRAPGQVIRPGENPGNGSGRAVGTPGRRSINGDNNETIGEQIATRSSRHVFTNDEVQTIAPRTETEKTRPAVAGKAVRSEQGETGAGTQQHGADRFRGDGEPQRRQMSRTNNTPSVSRPARESASSQPPSSERVRAMPPLSQSPAARQQAPSYSPPVHQSASPAAAPARSQAASSESHSSSSSSDGSRSRNR